MTEEASEILKNNLEHTFFSWVKQSGLNPINVERARGVYLHARDGKRYLDFSSQLMNVNIGHGDPRIAAAVKKQMDEVSYVCPSSITGIRGRLGRKLASIAPPSLNKVFLTLGGADSIENAIKVARLYSGRHKVIAQYSSYHGATYGAISAGGDPRRFPFDTQAAPSMVRVENPYYYRCPWNSASFEECGENAARHLERVIKFENPDAVAAVLLEGESGSSGCIKYPPFYLKKVREICDRYGILLIDDEVMSGFGRTGKWFAIEHHGVEPDIICMAKGLTSGYLPLGGIMVADKIARHFDDHPFVIGLTYSAHAASCAAALANIEVLEQDGLLDNTVRMGAYMEAGVEKLRQKHPSIGDFRNTGLLGCIELVKNRDSREPITPWNAKPNQMEATQRIAAKIREAGMFTFVRWNWIFTAPPLIVNEAQIDEGLDIISQALQIADEYCH